jgi:hypothetical protein
MFLAGQYLGREWRGKGHTFCCCGLETRAEDKTSTLRYLELLLRAHSST